MMQRRIRDFLATDKEFIASSKEDITAQNNRMLKDGCIAYAVVLLFYTIMTSFARASDLLAHMYYAFDILHAGLCVYIFKRPSQVKKDYRKTQFCCALLELSVLGFFVLEAAFVSRTQHSLYVPIAILLILLLFVHSARYTGVLTLLYVSSYAILSRLYKVPQAYINDLYIAVATCIAAVVGYILIARMRHNESALLHKYESLSKTDVLTGLYNKPAIEALCERIVSESSRPCALIVLDLDDFKRVNDLYGHAVGDEVIGLVGQALRMRFREMDYIGRFGGDEFIALMDNCANRQIVAQRIESILSGIADLRFSQPDLRICCSAGAAIKDRDESFQSLFRRADHALYDAKADKATQYRIAKPAP